MTGTDFLRVRKAVFLDFVSLPRKDVAASLQPPVAAEATYNGKDVAASRVTAVAAVLKPTVAAAAHFELFSLEPISGRDGDLRNPCILAEDSSSDEPLRPCGSFPVVQCRCARTKVRKAAKRSSFQLSTTEVLTDRPP